MSAFFFYKVCVYEGLIGKSYPFEIELIEIELFQLECLIQIQLEIANLSYFESCMGKLTSTGKFLIM